MMENSGVSDQVEVVNPNCLSDLELRLLAMFRFVSAQRQLDILRVLEVFAQTTK